MRTNKLSVRMVDRILEIKCPAVLENNHPLQAHICLNRQQLNNFCCKVEGDELVLKTNHKYYYQIQMQLEIYGLKWCDVIVWSKIGYITQRIVFDSVLWDSLRNLMPLPLWMHRFIVNSMFRLLLRQCNCIVVCTSIVNSKHYICTIYKYIKYIYIYIYNIYIYIYIYIYI